MRPCRFFATVKIVHAAQNFPLAHRPPNLVFEELAMRRGVGALGTSQA